MKILKESDPQTVYFSTIIEDRVVYGLKIEEVCQDGDIIKVDFKKGNGKLMKSMIYKITLKLFDDQNILTLVNHQFEIINQKQVKFSVNGTNIDLESNVQGRRNR